MKEFFKFTLATMTGIVLLFTTMTVIGLFTLGCIIASESSNEKIADNSVMSINLAGMVEERTDNTLDPLFQLLGTGMETMGLNQLTDAIKKAEKEPNIKGIYIEAGAVEFDSPATAFALRNALSDFKKSGKWVVAYGDNITQSAYFVASVADKFYLNHTGMIDFRGMGSKMEYYKGLYDKIGVNYQATRVGKYKSYVERQTRTSMSDEDREQRMTYLKGIWQLMLNDISASRKVNVAQLNDFANDSILAFADQKDYVKMKLIDGLYYPEELQKEIKKRLSIDEDDDISQVSPKQVALAVSDNKKKGDEVAIYYATGEITDQDLSRLTGEKGIVGRQTVKDLQELRDDEDVKAVVVRINSGGGSAVASEQIYHAMKELAKKKPLVVSMGGAAASGGYMMSCGADYIVAEPSTITGSIGIFGLIPNVSGLLTDKLGITFDEVSTNKYTLAMQNIVMDKDNSELLGMMQNYVDRGYNRFLTIVAQGRKMKKEQVHEVAQGRVWLAKDALQHHLVDRLGSLEDAVAKAAELAKLKEHHTAVYPSDTDWLEQLLNQQQQNNYLDGEIKKLLGSHYDEWVMMRTAEKRNRLQASLPFSIRMQ